MCEKMKGKWKAERVYDDGIMQYAAVQDENGNEILKTHTMRDAQGIVDEHNRTISTAALGSCDRCGKSIVHASVTLTDTHEILCLDCFANFPESPPKPSILDQEWEFQGRNKRTLLHKNSTLPVELSKWLEEIAAMPDVLRALVMIRKKSYTEMSTSDEKRYFRMFIDENQLEQLDAALKKAMIWNNKWAK